MMKREMKGVDAQTFHEHHLGVSRTVLYERVKFVLHAYWFFEFLHALGNPTRATLIG